MDLRRPSSISPRRWQSPSARWSSRGTEHGREAYGRTVSRRCTMKHRHRLVNQLDSTYRFGHPVVFQGSDELPGPEL